MPKVPAMLDDNEWLARLEESYTNRALGLPGFPAEERQKSWVGRAGIAALQEALPFYRKIKDHSELDAPILDFGIGWGRISRFFLNDLSSEQIHGVDVNKAILDDCKALKLPAVLHHIAPLGKLPYPDNFFGVVYAYSVFTHLSQKSADHWAQEIHRVLNPDGIFVFTLRTDDIFQNPLMASMFPNMKEAERRYYDGDFLFACYDNNPNELYGKSAVPISYIQKNWPFHVLEYVRDLGFEQGCCVTRKKPT